MLGAVGVSLFGVFSVGFMVFILGCLMHDAGLFTAISLFLNKYLFNRNRYKKWYIKAMHRKLNLKIYIHIIMASLSCKNKIVFYKNRLQNRLRRLLTIPDLLKLLSTKEDWNITQEAVGLTFDKRENELSGGVFTLLKHKQTYTSCITWLSLVP